MSFAINHELVEFSTSSARLCSREHKAGPSASSRPSRIIIVAPRHAVVALAPPGVATALL